MILSVDPGVRGCGCALWAPDGELLRAAYVRGEEDARAVFPDVVEVMTIKIAAWVRGAYVLNQLVIERPQTYHGRARKGDANDLLDLSIMVGAVHVHLGAPTRYTLPAEWKGQTPKSATEARARKKLGALVDRVELPGRDKKLASNVWDAVGIGFWYFREVNCVVDKPLPIAHG